MPESTAAGRLFDAAAALTGLCLTASFEGQGPMYLEASAVEADGALELPLRRDAGGLLRGDWRALIELMAQRGRPAGERAALFHASLADLLVRQALAVRARQAIEYVGLCGGVFQNRRLTEACVAGLARHGLTVRLCERVPVNDAGISFGQVVEHAFAAPAPPLG